MDNKFFYSEYSDYSPEQIKSDQYEDLCNELLRLAKNDKIKEQMEAILYDGGYDNFSVNTKLTKNDPVIERSKRVGRSYILATYPETHEIFVENDVNLFHGTNANALPNILKYGMKSVNEQSNSGIPTLTGEEWSRIKGKRSFISFTDDIDTSLDYASVTPNNESTQESFGVIIGISSSSLTQLRTCIITSDLPEIGIMDNIPLEYIKTISVPEDKVEFVRKLVGNSSIIVTPIDIGDKFYYMDLNFGTISFEPDEAKKLAEKKQNTKGSFTGEELLKMTNTRKKSRILALYEKLKNIIKGRKKDGEDSRDK